MNEHFAIGEIAIVSGGMYPELIGRECEVFATPSPGLRWGGKMVPDGEYVISIGGEIWASQAKNLRKKRPPREDLQLVRWSECPWQPATVNS